MIIKEFYEILLLTLTIFAESRGESFDGKLGVGNVVRNRVNHHKKSYQEIILKSKQFSCYNDKDEMIISIFNSLVNKIEYKALKESYKISHLIYNNKIGDNTWGALFYARSDIDNYWTVRKILLIIIDSHKFYGNKNYICKIY